jgi:hypothetical protein
MRLRIGLCRYCGEPEAEFFRRTDRFVTPGLTISRLTQSHDMTRFGTLVKAVRGAPGRGRNWR